MGYSDDLIQLLDSFFKKKRILAIDHSKTKLGLSLSNKDFTLATPLTVIKRTKLLHDIKKLDSIINEWDIGVLLVGLPLNMDGSSGTRVQSVKDFSKHLEEKFVNIPLIFWDERLSTFAANTHYEDNIYLTKKKNIDAHAATIVLQNALDYWQKKVCCYDK